LDSETSEAQVTFPADECSDALATVMPDAHELVIFRVEGRQTRVVWAGTIRDVTSTINSKGNVFVTFNCEDVTNWAADRYIDREYSRLPEESADSALVWKDIWDLGMEADPPLAPEDILVGPSYVPWSGKIADGGVEKLDAALARIGNVVSWRVIGGVLQIGGSGYPRASEIGLDPRYPPPLSADLPPVGTLKADFFKSRVSSVVTSRRRVSLWRGVGQADPITGRQVTGRHGTARDATGKFGTSGWNAEQPGLGVDPWFGLREQIIEVDGGVEAIGEQAAQAWSRSNRPTVIMAPDAALRPDAETSIQLLLPGTLWDVGVKAPYGGDKETAYRFRLVSVNVSFVGESGAADYEQEIEPEDAEQITPLFELAAL
jgi:hypothetical protein